MRVLVLLPDNLSKPTGGLGVQLAHIMRHSQEIDWDIIGHPDENPGKNYKQVENPLPEVQHASLVTILGQMSYLAEAMRRPRPDLVHAYDWSTFFAGHYAARHFEVPLVTTMQLSINLLNMSGISYSHDSKTVDGHWINQTHCEMEKFGLFNSQRVIHVSKGYAKRFAGIEEKSRIIPNGIDIEDWKSFNRKKLPGKGRIKLVYIGRMALMKNIQSLVETEVPEEIDMIFVGNDRGGEPHVYESMIKFVERNENVHYYGESFGQDKIDLLNSADAMIVPSVHEPFGIVALEGLASKSIVLSSRADGLGDFMNDENSIFCGTSPDTIEKAYEKLLSLTPRQRSKMIDKGLRTLKNYTWESAAKSTKEVYKEATDTFSSSSVSPRPLKQ